MLILGQRFLQGISRYGNMRHSWCGECEYDRVKKVLLIDDDADDRLSFCEALKEVDIEVICLTAADGKAAILLLKEKGEGLPDLIFLDINMSGKSGWHYLNILKEDSELQHIPVIMYSTSSTNPDIEKAVNLGALILFTKPITLKI